MAPIKALSDLKFRVRFDMQPFEAGNPSGGVLGNWKEQFTRWAHIGPMQGRETVMAQRLVGIQPTLIVVRYDVQTVHITPAWRAVEVRGDRPVKYYALKTAEDMERERRFITMLAVAGDPDA
jgi:SPP1 family predicted phage head-tail adaptor